MMDSNLTLDETNNSKSKKNANKDEISRIEELKLDFTVISVGLVESIFNKKNGTPRQSGICPQSKGVIRLHKKLFNNPMHAFEGIEQFQYVWILYYFHENNNKRRFLAKVHPPRLNGACCGIFASRAPHRPNPFGLTLAKIDYVKDGLLYISGIDIIDGTPIVDIKPFIDKYDYPAAERVLIPAIPNDESNKEDIIFNKSSKDDIVLDYKTPNVPEGWVDGSIVTNVDVEFTSRSLEQLSKFHPKSFHDLNTSCIYCFRLFQSYAETKQALVNLLQADPRSVYRRNKCVDRLYFFTIDAIHVTAWFDIETNLVEVVKIKPYTQNLS